jgi:hypothetical protein
MLKFANTEAFWMSVARAPLAFGAPRGVETIDPPYEFAGMKKWFGKADMAGIIFCVAFCGQRQHAKRLVTAIKGHLKNLASTHDEFAVTVREGNWELSDGNTRALLYKALLLKKMELLRGDIPVSYTYDDLPLKVRVSFTETASPAQSLLVYNQYNSREAVKTTRDTVHTALKMTASEFGLELQSDFFRNEGAIVTASEYAFFPGRVKADVAVKVLQPILPTLDQMGLTRKAGLATTLPGGAVAALAVVAGIDAVTALEFAQAVVTAEVDEDADKLVLPALFALRVRQFKARHQFSSAGALRPAVAELVGIALSYVHATDKDMLVPVTFCEPVSVTELVARAQAEHPMLAAVFARRDALLLQERQGAAQGSLALDAEPAAADAADAAADVAAPDAAPDTGAQAEAQAEDTAEEAVA